MNEFLPAIEKALSKAWGGTVTLALRETLADRRHVARLTVLTSPADMPKTVILKRWRSEGDAGFDQNSLEHDLVNEWSSLEFMTQIFGKGSLTPQLFAGDKENGFLVIEDLPEGSTLDTLLQGDNLVQAEETLRQFGEALGKLHAQTLAQSETFSAIRTRLAYPGHGAHYETLDLLQDALKTVEGLGFEVQTAAYSDAQDAAKHLSRLEGFSVLQHGDPAPNNSWLDNTGGFYLFDFESAHFNHAIVEGVTMRMGFPTMAMAFVNRLPESIWRQSEAAYFKALATRCPEAADASLYGAIIPSACALWTLVFCQNWLERTLGDALPPAQLNRIRQVAISRIEAFVQASQEFNSLPALGETFAKLLGQLRSKWPSEAHELPLYPVFQEGKP